MTATKTTFDFSVPCHGDRAGHVWFPVGYDGTDRTGDPQHDYDGDGNSAIGGRVTAAKAVRGCSATCYRKYSSRSAARAAAVRLTRKLKAATSDAEHNAIVSAWYAR